MVLVIVGSLNWLSVGLFKLNVVETLLGKGSVARSIYIIVGIAALSMMFYRDTYLPFLGDTVMPCSALKEQTPRGADTEVRIHLGESKKGRKVIYWASEPDKEHLSKLKDWREAYLKYENVGVVVVDQKGDAVLQIRKPQPYTVPIYGRLEPHVHYRVCGEESDKGMLARVETVFLNADGSGHSAEGFQGTQFENADGEGKLFY